MAGGENQEYRWVVSTGVSRVGETHLPNNIQLSIMPTEQIKALGTLVERILAGEDSIIGTVDDHIDRSGRVRGFNVRIGPSNQYAQMTLWPGQATVLVTKDYRVSRIVEEQIDEADIETAMKHAQNRDDAVETVVRRDLKNIVDGCESDFDTALDAADARGVQVRPLYYSENGEIPDGMQAEVRMPVHEDYSTSEYIRDRDALLQAFREFKQSLEPELPLSDLGDTREAAEGAEQKTETKRVSDPPDSKMFQ